MRKHSPDLVIIDGPLIPPEALKGPKKIGSRAETAEKEATDRYCENVTAFLEEAERRRVSVVGFVKRPLSRYLCQEGLVSIGREIADTVALNYLLKVGEYAPAPPRRLDVDRIFAGGELLDVVRRMKPAYTFIRMREGEIPARIDFGPLTVEPEKIISFLYEYRLRDGLPYHVAKVDEETKFTDKIVREIYEDAIHTYIRRLLREEDVKPLDVAPVMPARGWRVGR